MNACADADVRSVWAAYDAASSAWAHGPQLVYGRLAEALLDITDRDLTGRRVLDLGAGAGAVSTVVGARGGRPVALDGALGMARATGAARVPSVQGDAARLPFRAATFDIVAAAFVVNHLADPMPTLSEAHRVLAPSGELLVSTFAPGPDHPVKDAVDDAARARGWRSPGWYDRIKSDISDRVARPESIAAMVRTAGFTKAEADARRVVIHGLSVEALVAYRLGMGSLAGFVGELAADDRVRLVDDAVARLGPSPEPLRPAVTMLRAVKAGEPPRPA